MTATPALLRAIADMRDTLTPAEIQAKADALQAKVNSFLTEMGDSVDILDALQVEIDADAADLATANTGNTAAAARETAQGGYITDLNQTITDLQAQIAAGAPPATPEDIAERDEVHALLADFGITQPALVGEP
jgi:hypothetical protein